MSTVPPSDQDETQNLSSPHSETHLKPPRESSNQSEPPPLTPSHSTPHSDSNGFSRGFWITLLILVISVGSLEYFFSQWSVKKLNQIIDSSGQESKQEEQKEPQKVHINRAWISDVFKQGQDQYKALHRQLNQQIESEFQAIQQDSQVYLKTWLDWYYSVTGEYARLLQLAAGDLDEYMATQIYTLLIEPVHLEQRIPALEKKLQTHFHLENQKILDQLNQSFTEIIEKTQKEGELVDEDVEWLKSQQTNLNSLQDLTTLSTPAITTKIMAMTLGKVALKTGVKAVTGLGVKGSIKAGGKTGLKTGTQVGVKIGGKVSQYVLAKIGAKSAVKMASQLWAKLLLKFGLKTGGKASALAAGGSATMACSWLGLGAVVCGVGAAALTWIAVDHLIIEIDEYLNREEFEKQIQEDLKQTWIELEDEMHTELDQYFQKLDQALFSKQTLPKTSPSSTRLIDQLEVSDHPSTPSTSSSSP